MKKIFLSLICFALLFILTGCGNKISTDDIEKYLSDKYNEEFSYVNKSDGAWYSNASTYIYSDKYENKFEVRAKGSNLSDNYYHIVYDDDISTIFGIELDNNYKIYASSSSIFTGSSKICQDAVEYIDNISRVDVSIYTLSNDFHFIESKFNEVVTANNFKTSIYVTVYQVPTDKFSEITSNVDYSGDVISTEEFYFVNGILTVYATLADK